MPSVPAGELLSHPKSGGHAILVDDFRGRAGRGAEALASQPFAALTGAAPVADAVRRAGFAVLRAGVFDAANAARWPALGETATRHVVAAAR